MRLTELAEGFRQIEATPERRRMTWRLADLFLRRQEDLAGLPYLLQGHSTPVRISAWTSIARPSRSPRRLASPRGRSGGTTSRWATWGWWRNSCCAASEWPDRADPFEVVVLGCYGGQGKHARREIGSPLRGVYEPRHERFRTILVPRCRFDRRPEDATTETEAPRLYQLPTHTGRAA